MNNYDAIIIGAGHNGLTNAAYLAKAGLNVVVLEKNEFIGGAAVSRELHEGWTYSMLLLCLQHDAAGNPSRPRSRPAWPDPGALPWHGQLRRWRRALVPYHDEEAAHLELKRHSPHDADAMHRFQTDLTRYSQLIRKTLMRTPPDPTSFRPRDIMELLCLPRSSGHWAKKRSTSTFDSLR